MKVYTWLKIYTGYLRTYFWSFHHKKGDKATEMQGINESERKDENFNEYSEQ